MKREVSLNHRSMVLFAICVAVMLLLATPLFYYLTRNYYAEDMADLIVAVQSGAPLPNTDLEGDIITGIMLQFVLIVTIIGAAIVLTLWFISRRLWQPFDTTLAAVERFRLEDGRPLHFATTHISEFRRLNDALLRLTNNSLHSYRLQKEFTENASHELQTPLAVFRSKLDLLLQQPELTERQALIIADLYDMNTRLAHLNRNLLLLAKMENGQFHSKEETDAAAVIMEIQSYLDNLATGITLHIDIRADHVPLRANRSLLESLVTNLTVNAIRHNRPGGDVFLSLSPEALTVSNTSNEPALDATRIFERFYRPSTHTLGNGLGLAIVKAVADYHSWHITYTYRDGLHTFNVRFCN